MENAALPDKGPWLSLSARVLGMRSGGLALQISHFLGLLVGAVLSAAKLILRFAFALLFAAFASQRRIPGDIAGSLLDLASRRARSELA